MISPAQNFISLFQAGLEQEKNAEHYSAKLMKIFGENSKHYNKVQEINSDEKHHEKIVEEIIAILQKA